MSESIGSQQTSAGTQWCDKRHPETGNRTGSNRPAPESWKPVDSMLLDLIFR